MKPYLVYLRLILGILLFDASSTSAQYTTLINFIGSLGTHPSGDLIYDGNYLYGLAGGGGINGYGVIFKIKPDGSSYNILLNFNGVQNGGGPTGSLIYDGIFLYGMTHSGGVSNLGTVFKIKPDGNGYLKLYDFGGLDGSSPYGSLISDGTFLYGMTNFGGLDSMGVIFKIKTDGTGFLKLLDFASSANGSFPQGNLFLNGAFIYGLTVEGGITNFGTIFKINTNGTGFVKLHDFHSAPGGDGEGPYGSLISDGVFLYGITFAGGSSTNCGTNGCGCILK